MLTDRVVLQAFSFVIKKCDFTGNTAAYRQIYGQIDSGFSRAVDEGVAMPECCYCIVATLWAYVATFCHSMR